MVGSGWGEGEGGQTEQEEGAPLACDRGYCVSHWGALFPPERVEEGEGERTCLKKVVSDLTLTPCGGQHACPMTVRGEGGGGRGRGRGRGRER